VAPGVLSVDDVGVLVVFGRPDTGLEALDLSPCALVLLTAVD